MSFDSDVRGYGHGPAGVGGMTGARPRQSLISEVERLARRLTAEERLDLINRLFASLEDDQDPLRHAESLPEGELVDIPVCSIDSQVNMDVISAKYQELLDPESIAELLRRPPRE
jgi:hypothetical protein